MGNSYYNDEPHSILEHCLRDIINLLEPSQTDRAQRLNVIEEIASILRSQPSLRDATVKPFGSFTSNLYSKWGDLDISVDFPDIRASDARQCLFKIRTALQWAGFALDCGPPTDAKVPVLTFRSNYRDISCDISINNHAGQIKSKILLWISDIDERFHDMVLLVKEWAKAQNINNPKEGTLNSYSLCLMVIYHFQTCQPPILPPLNKIYNRNVADGVTEMTASTERRIRSECIENIARFKSQVSRQRNGSSLSQLLIAFFHKFSEIHTFSSRKILCTYTGQIGTQWLPKSQPLWIEDLFDPRENAARAVRSPELMRISGVFSEAYMTSSNFRSDRVSLLANLVRPSIRSQLEGGTDTDDDDDDDDEEEEDEDEDEDDDNGFSMMRMGFLWGFSMMMIGFLCIAFGTP